MLPVRIASPRAYENAVLSDRAAEFKRRSSNHWSEAGTASAAKTPTIATETMSSVKVKPDFRREKRPVAVECAESPLTVVYRAFAGVELAGALTVTSNVWLLRPP